MALGGSTFPEAGPRDAATTSGVRDALLPHAQPFVYLQESSRNQVRGHIRAQSARVRAPVKMAEPQHVFRSFPTSQAAW